MVKSSNTKSLAERPEELPEVAQGKIEYGILPALLLVAAHVLLLVSLPAMPLLDFPNHLTRCWMIKEQLLGRPTNFVFEWHFMPYVLGDLLYAGVLSAVPWRAAETLWAIFCYLSLPVGVYAYARSMDFSRRLVGLLLLFSAYAAANWFFLSGFANYCLGVGLALGTAAACQRLYCGRSPSERLRRLAAGAALASICYLVHLAAFLFAAIMVGARTLARLLQHRESLLSAASAALPFGLLLVLHLLLHGDAPDQSSPWEHRPFLEKPLAIGAMYVRYHAGVDALLFGVLFGGLALLAFKSSHSEKRADPAGLREELAVLLALTLAYLVLPVRAEPAYGVDSRAIPFISIAAVSLLGKIIEARGARRFRAALLLTAAVAGSSLLYLIPFVRAHANFTAALDRAREEVPPGFALLPVATVPNIGRVQPNLHRPELYLLDGGRFAPYIFSLDTSGGQIKYFRYSHGYPYAPHIKWYLNGESIRGEEVARVYDYLLVSRPYDPARFAEVPLEKVFENEAAAVFKVIKAQAVAPPQLLPEPAVQP